MGFELDDIQPGNNEKVMPVAEVELSELYHHQTAAGSSLLVCSELEQRSK